MNPNIVVIVALSVDSERLTLWKTDGNTVTIPQGDTRVATIVAEAKAKGLAPGKPVSVDITMHNASKKEYADAEQGTNGLVRFFRVAKKKLSEFFADETEVKPAALVETIFLGSTATLGAKAMDTFLAVRDATPAAEAVEEVEHVRGGSKALWITAHNPGNRVGAIKALREFVGIGLKEASDKLNEPLPIRVSIHLSEDQAVHYAGLLAKEGVVTTILDVGDKPPVLPVAESNASKLDAAEEKLMKLGGISTNENKFHEPLAEDETIVAVVNNTVVPGVEGIQRQIRQSAKLKDFRGFTKFLERLAPVIKNRRHSVEDLMQFMETGNLPIADDGSIVIFKRLNLKGSPKHVKAERVYVDVHSGNIEQAVGSKVQVREDLVDQNRRQDCSHGLHVATQQYITSFSGNVTIIGKVAPEDVFAVPEYSKTKMRVAAYHIVEELPPVIRDHVNNGRPIDTIPGGAEILNRVLSGKHSQPNLLVHVAGHRGTNLTYTVLNATLAEPEVEVGAYVEKPTIDMEESLDVTPNTAPVVKATDVKPITKKKTNMELADDLWNQFQNAETATEAARIAGELIAHKGKMKCSWSNLGLSSDMVQQLADARTKMPVERKPEPVKKAVVSAPAKGSKHADTIRGYLNDAGMSDYSKAHAIHDLKRAAKKSYAALGLTEDEVKAIDKLKHHLK